LDNLNNCIENNLALKEMEDYLKKKRLQCNKIGKMKFIRYYMEKPEIKKKRKRERKKKEKKLEEIKESQTNIRIQIGESQNKVNEQIEQKEQKEQKEQNQQNEQNVVSSDNIQPLPTEPETAQQDQVTLPPQSLNFAPQPQTSQMDNQRHHIDFTVPKSPIKQNFKYVLINKLYSMTAKPLNNSNPYPNYQNYHDAQNQYYPYTFPLPPVPQNLPNFAQTQSQSYIQIPRNFTPAPV
jgi:hypothetical protein